MKFISFKFTAVLKYDFYDNGSKIIFSIINVLNERQRIRQSKNKKTQNAKDQIHFPTSSN